MSQFFINRPVFAWVIAILITLAGVFTLPNLPISQYPNVAPPSVTIRASYPGAAPEDLANSVTSIIENQLNGIEGLLYYESTSDSFGSAKVTVTFAPGSDPDLAQVQVQNKVSNITAKLPQAVTQQGITYSTESSNFLLIVTVTDKAGKMSPSALGDFITRNLQNPISRIKGVGQFQLFASQQAMRVWVDPDKLNSYGLTMTDITAALKGQNVQISGGTLGSPPNPSSQATSALLNVSGQLVTVQDFKDVILKSTTGGSVVRLKDVADISVGASSYQFGSRLNGQPSAAFAVSLSGNANALETAGLIEAEMKKQAEFFPTNLSWAIPYNTAPYVKESIVQVLHTLGEAMILVFIVMFVFLQNIRYTLIPAIVVPIAMMGTASVLYFLGYSINVLTMFAMVLAIGILVDDAIVVVENVERIMREEGLPPKAATEKAMPQISSAIIGITLVLITVFSPLLFVSGSAGVIYRQFAVAIATSIAFSSILALIFTPALCSSILKPISKGDHENKGGFFGWFNRFFDRFNHGYSKWIGKILNRGAMMMIIWAILVGITAILFTRIPSSFLPEEDQGVMITNVELPSGVSQDRTLTVLKQIEQYYAQQPEVANTIAVQGFSFNGSGLNSAIVFTPLKPFDERKGAEHSAKAVQGKAFGALFFGIPDATIFPIIPPSIPSLGNASGFDMRLEDRGGQGQEALQAATAQLLAAAAKSDIVQQVRVNGLGPGPYLDVKIDREKVAALNVSMTEVNSVISTAIGSSLVGQYPNLGWMSNIWVQAQADKRMSVDDLLKLRVHNASGGLVALSNFISAKWTTGPTQIGRYNGYDAVSIGGSAKPGYSNGQAIDEMQRLVGQLPSGFAYEWSGLSYQEIQAGSQQTIIMGMAIVVVFLVLAALYESWAIPLAALLIVPLGMLGTTLLVKLTGMNNDIYFKVGMITVIGLAAKNAILIVEFAKDSYANGSSLVDAAIEACHLRLRPILMTSFAFILGVVPLVLASGAGAASQKAVGIGVLGGMLAATPFALLFVPTFFVVVLKLFKSKPRLLGSHAKDKEDKEKEAQYKSEIYSEIEHLKDADDSATKK